MIRDYSINACLGQVKMFPGSLCAVNEVANSVFSGGLYEVRVNHIEVPNDRLDFFVLREQLSYRNIIEGTLGHQDAAFDGR